MNIDDLRERAASGSVVAQSILGICYLQGTEVEVDYNEALRLLSLAAEKGASRASVSLARMYEEGLGTEKEIGTAIHLYESAAQKGEFFAQIALGRIFAKGVEAPSDPSRAMHWYSVALSQSGRVEDCDELREAATYVKGKKTGGKE